MCGGSHFCWGVYSALAERPVRECKPSQKFLKNFCETVRYYSFTPPTATPAMMYLDRQKYTISSGMAVRVRPR